MNLQDSKYRKVKLVFDVYIVGFDKQFYTKIFKRENLKIFLFWNVKEDITEIS